MVFLGGGGCGSLLDFLGENDIELLNGKINIRSPQSGAQHLPYRCDHIDRRKGDAADQVVLPRKPVTGAALYLVDQPAQSRGITDGNLTCILRMAFREKGCHGDGEHNRNALQKSNSQTFFHN